MTPEEKAAADAAAAAAKAEADAKAKAEADAASKRESDPEYLRQELKKAAADRDTERKRRKELESAEAELKKLKEAQMSEQEKLAARIKELEPGAARAKALEETVGKFLEAEVADVPEALRSLIPELPAEQKLLWIKDAKAKGIFGAGGAGSPGGRKPERGGGNTLTMEELVGTGEDVSGFAERQKAIRTGKAALAS